MYSVRRMCKIMTCYYNPPPVNLVRVSGRKYLVSEVLHLLLVSLLVLNSIYLLALYQGLCFGSDV
jgi:hypothetical protein